MNSGFQVVNEASPQLSKPLPPTVKTKKGLLNHLYHANSDTEYIYKKFIKYRHSNRKGVGKFVDKVRDKLDLSIRSGTQSKRTTDSFRVLINNKIDSLESLYKKIQNFYLQDPELQKSVARSLRERNPEDPLNIFLIFLVQSLFKSRNITEQNDSLRVLKLFSEAQDTDGSIPNLSQQYFSEGFTFFQTERPKRGLKYFSLEIPRKETSNSEMKIPARLGEMGGSYYQLLLAPYSSGLLVSGIFEENGATIINPLSAENFNKKFLNRIFFMLTCGTYQY